MRIDIIVPTTKAALEFAIKHRDEFWPNARILFYSVSARVLAGIPLGDHVVGLMLPRGIAATVDLARRLQPDARRLLVIAGVSELDKDVVEDAREVLAARPEQLETEYLLGLPQAELVDRLAQEPASSIVLLLFRIRDREGRPYIPRDLARAISAVSSAPVYGYIDIYLGEGIAGGMLLSYEDLGRMIAEAVAAVRGRRNDPGPCRCPKSLPRGRACPAQVVAARATPARGLRGPLRRAVPLA